MTKLHQSRLKLKKLAWLLGRWKGKGVANTIDQQELLHAELSLNESFLFVTESIFVDKEPFHEDCTWCHWKPEEQQLGTQRFMPTAHHERRIINMDPNFYSTWRAGPNCTSPLIALKETVLHAPFMEAENHCLNQVRYRKTPEQS